MFLHLLQLMESMFIIKNITSYNFSLTWSIGKKACKIDKATPTKGRTILNEPPINNAYNKLEQANKGKKYSINSI